MVADISQSTDRGRVCLTGLVPTLTTSSILYNYGRGCFLAPKDLMSMHGLAAQKLRMPSFSDGDIKSLVGNIMCSTTQVLALTPVLCALGVLKKTSDQRTPTLEQFAAETFA